MLLVTVDALRNALTPDQKERLIEKITTALVEMRSESTCPVAWVRINEVESGDWAVGGQRLSAHDVLEMRRGRRPPFIDTGPGG